MDVTIHAEDLWYKYPGSSEYAIKGISVSMYSGNVYLVVGENGSGKSTLLMVLAGLLKPAKGDVKINGVSIFDKGANLRRYIGLLFQNPDAMLFNPSVYEELVYSIKQIEDDEEKIRDMLSYWLDYFDLDSSILGKKPYTLSYGHKKIVALISILMYSPMILLLDEPHTGLARRYSGKLYKLIVDHKRRGGIAVIATHNVRPYVGAVDCIIKLKNGSVTGKWRQST